MKAQVVCRSKCPRNSVLMSRCASIFILLHFTGLPRVRKMSGKNKIFSRSGKSQGILKKWQGILAIWPMPGNFVMSCQGIVREFCHDIIFRLKLPSCDKGFSQVVYINVCLANINSRELFLLNFCLSIILGVWGNCH